MENKSKSDVEGVEAIASTITNNSSGDGAASVIYAQSLAALKAAEIASNCQVTVARMDLEFRERRFDKLLELTGVVVPAILELIKDRMQKHDQAAAARASAAAAAAEAERKFREEAQVREHLHQAEMARKKSEANAADFDQRPRKRGGTHSF